MHFVEYGQPGGVAFLGFRNDLGSWDSFVSVVVLVALLGYLDEGMQYDLPRRHFGWHDVLIDAYSGVLGVLLLQWGLTGLRLPKDEAQY